MPQRLIFENRGQLIAFFFTHINMMLVAFMRHAIRPPHTVIAKIDKGWCWVSAWPTRQEWKHALDLTVLSHLGHLTMLTHSYGIQLYFRFSALILILLFLSLYALSSSSLSGIMIHCCHLSRFPPLKSRPSSTLQVPDCLTIYDDSPACSSDH